MKLQHTTHSLQRNHEAERLPYAESADHDLKQQEYEVMGWLKAARKKCALLFFDHYPTGDLTHSESFTAAYCSTFAVNLKELWGRLLLIEVTTHDTVFGTRPRRDAASVRRIRGRRHHAARIQHHVLNCRRAKQKRYAKLSLLSHMRSCSVSEPIFSRTRYVLCSLSIYRSPTTQHLPIHPRI
jgi:hypothetical protein